MQPDDILYIIPELTILGFANVILLQGVFFKKSAKVSFYLTVLALLVSGLLTFKYSDSVIKVFQETYIINNFTNLVKLLINGFCLAILVYSKKYLCERSMLRSEFFVLFLLSLLGMEVLISSNHFLTMYLGIELIVFPLYALIVFGKKTDMNIEAAIKYFILGGIGACVMLFGMSMIYGVNASLDFAVSPEAKHLMLRVGLLFCLIGVFIEFGAAPFHMWLPDVYQGAPLVVTLIIGSIPKLAILVILYRLLTESFIHQFASLTGVIEMVGILSIIIGNILALTQTNIRRMLGFSTVSHVGFIILATKYAPQVDYVTALFYTVSYLLMVLSAFACLIYLSQKDYEVHDIVELSGLSEKYPFIAFALMITMLSMAGIPPLVGFYAKFYVLMMLVNVNQYTLATVALFFSIVGTFYYLRVIKTMYFDESSANKRDYGTPLLNLSGQMLLTINTSMLVVLGVFPGLLMSICRYTF